MAWHIYVFSYGAILWWTRHSPDPDSEDNQVCSFLENKDSDFGLNITVTLKDF